MVIVYHKNLDEVYNPDLFDSSRDRSPLEFTLGNGEMIPGFENAVIGMKIGDTKTARIPAMRRMARISMIW